MTDLVQPVRIAALMALDVASAAVVGVLLNLLWLGENVAAHLYIALRRCLISAAAVLFLAASAALLALTASMSDATNWAALRSALPDVVNTEAGSALTHTIGASIALLAVVLSPLHRRFANFAALTLTCFVFFLRTPFGHAASDGPWTLREAVQFVHLASVAVWSGGVMIAGLLVMPRLAKHSEQAGALGRRLSLTMTYALPCVLLSGMYNSWKGLGGSLAPLPHTDWGRLLLAKLLVVGVALALAIRARSVLHRPSLGNTSAQDRHIGKWLRAEAVTMLMILLLSAWLANAAPADMSDGMASSLVSAPTTYVVAMSHP